MQENQLNRTSIQNHHYLFMILKIYNILNNIDSEKKHCISIKFLGILILFLVHIIYTET